jgi:uncharacterized membrane protein
MPVTLRRSPLRWVLVALIAVVVIVGVYAFLHPG